MNTIKTRILFLIAVALLLAGTVPALAAVSKGNKAPDFKLKSVDGKTLSLTQLRQNPAKKGTTRVVLIDFWATWCPPCREEIPHLQALQKKYAPKGFVVVGVAEDRGGASDVSPFVKKQKITYPVLLDSNGAVGTKYGVRYLPTMYLVDKKGVVHAVHIGFTDESVLDKEINSLLK